MGLFEGPGGGEEADFRVARGMRDRHNTAIETI